MYVDMKTNILRKTLSLDTGEVKVDTEEGHLEPLVRSKGCMDNLIRVTECLPRHPMTNIQLLQRTLVHLASTILRHQAGIALLQEDSATMDVLGQHRLQIIRNSSLALERAITEPCPMCLGAHSRVFRDRHRVLPAT